MRSVNLDLLWDKWDRLRSYDRSLVDVYAAVKRVIELDVQARKSYALAFKSQADMLAKLSADLKAKPNFLIFQDSLSILTELKNKQMERFKIETDDLVENVYNPLNAKLTANEEILSKINQGDKNFLAWVSLSKTVSDTYSKFYSSGQQYDLIYEDEQVKQQVKNRSFSLSRLTSSKAIKSYEKMKDEEKSYRCAVENYNKHTSTCMNENVRLSLRRESASTGLLRILCP